MNTPKIFMALIFVFGVTNFVNAEEQYWPTIKQLVIEMDKAKGWEANDAAATKYKEYIGSLSIEQLLTRA